MNFIWISTLVLCRPLSKITFSEWQLNQFDNVQFSAVGAYSPLLLRTCNCRLLSGVTRVCFTAESFSSPDSRGGRTPWEGHDRDSGLRRFPLAPLFSPCISHLSQPELPAHVQFPVSSVVLRNYWLDRLHFRSFLRCRNFFFFFMLFARAFGILPK